MSKRNLNTAPCTRWGKLTITAVNVNLSGAGVKCVGQFHLPIKTNNFAFEVKVILGLESTFPDGLVDKIGLNGSECNRVKV